MAHSLLTGQFNPPTAVDPGQPTEHPDSSSLTSRLSPCGPEAEYYRGVARIGVQVADALAYAHRQGILHRDVKPSNLLLDLQGTVWVTDFGLAKAEGTEELTHTGDIVGTIRFMAPERFEGKSLPQSDVYGLGLTLYELLTLRPAFDDTNKGRLIDRVLHEPPRPPCKLDPRVPRDLETLVLKCLTKDPSERYATAEALAKDLRRFLADRPIHARRATAAEQAWRWCRRNPWLAGLSAAVLLLLLVVAMGSLVFALRLQQELGHRRQAEGDALEKLFTARVAEAQARRYSGRSGQRFKSLEAIQEAVQLARRLQKPPETFDELRNEAIAALCLPDIDDGGPQWKTACPASDMAFDPTGQGYVQVDEGHAYYCRLVDGKEQRLKELHVSGRALFGEWHSPDLRFLALGSPHIPGKGYDWLKLWRCDGPQAKLVLEDRGISESATAFRPDGRQLAVGHRDGTLTVHDTETGAVVRQWQVGVPPFAAMFHPRLPRLAVACGAEVRLYDVESGALLSPRFTNPNGVSAVAWNPDGRRLAIDCFEQKLVLWDSETGQQLTPHYEGLGGAGLDLRFNATGDRLLTADWGGILRLWDAGTGKQLFNTPRTSLRPTSGYWPRFCRDDQCLVLRFAGDTIKLLRFAPGREHRVLISATPSIIEDDFYHLLYPHGWLLSADLAIEGRFGFDASGALLSRNANGVFRWPVRVDAGSPESYRLGPPQRVTSQHTAQATIGDEPFGASRDGRVLAFAHATHATVVHMGPPLRTLTLGPQYDVRHVSVSPDGRWVVTGSRWADPNGENAKVWEASTGKLITVLPIGADLKPVFSADGIWLHTTNPTHRSPYWCKVGTWQPKAVPRPSGLLAPDGRLLACLAGYGEILLVNFETGKEMARLSIPPQTRLEPRNFSPDGAWLYAIGWDPAALSLGPEGHSPSARRAGFGHGSASVPRADGPTDGVAAAGRDGASSGAGERRGQTAPVGADAGVHRLLGQSLRRRCPRPARGPGVRGRALRGCVRPPVDCTNDPPRRLRGSPPAGHGRAPMRSVGGGRRRCGLGTARATRSPGRPRGSGRVPAAPRTPRGGGRGPHRLAEVLPRGRRAVRAARPLLRRLERRGATPTPTARRRRRSRETTRGSSITGPGISSPAPRPSATRCERWS